MVLATLITACSAAKSGRLQDDVLRATGQYRSVVAFDLRDDSNPTAALVIRGSGASRAAPARKTILLPFPTRSAVADRDIFSAWGSFGECCSVVSYTPIGSDSHTIALEPTFAAQPGNYADLASGLSGQIYLIRFGQERAFVYPYDLPSSNDDFKKQLSSRAMELPAAIAIARPSKAKGVEIRDGKTEIPAHLASNGIASIYPATSTDRGVRRLEIRYQLPLTSAQSVFIKVVVEFVTVVAAPLGALFFLESPDPQKKRTRSVVITILALAEIGLLCVIGYFGLKDWGTESLSAILTSATVVIGVGLSILVAYLKRGALAPGKTV